MEASGDWQVSPLSYQTEFSQGIVTSMLLVYAYYMSFLGSGLVLSIQPIFLSPVKLMVPSMILGLSHGLLHKNLYWQV